MPQDKKDKPSFKEEKAGGGSLEQGSETKRNPTRNTGLNPSSDHLPGGHPITKSSE